MLSRDSIQKRKTINYSILKYLLNVAEVATNIVQLYNKEDTTTNQNMAILRNQSTKDIKKLFLKAATVIKKENIFALEDWLERKRTNPFLKQLLLYLVHGIEPDIIVDHIVFHYTLEIDNQDDWNHKRMFLQQEKLVLKGIDLLSRGTHPAELKREIEQL